MGKPGPKATNIFQKLKLGNNSVKSMPKYNASPVKKAKGQKLDESKIDPSEEALARRNAILNRVDAADGKTSRPAPGKKQKATEPGGGSKYNNPVIDTPTAPGKKHYKSHAKKLKTPSPAKSIFNKKISEKRAKRKESKGKGRIEYKIGGGYYHNEETGERGYEPGHEPGGVHNRGRYISNKGKVKAVGRKHKSHAKKKNSMAYKFKSNAQRKAAYASGYKGK